jgi:hypothetical protein
MQSQFDVKQYRKCWLEVEEKYVTSQFKIFELEQRIQQINRIVHKPYGLYLTNEQNIRANVELINEEK